MKNDSQPGKRVMNTQNSSPRWVQWATGVRRRAQSVTSRHKLQKSSYRELEPEKRRSFAEEQAITVVLEPAGALHVIEIFLPGI